MTLNTKLVSLRKQKGFTQLDLAARLNVSRQAVSRWESGLAVPSTDNLKVLAAGETVTIKASYAPFSASVDFGLIAPNGVYYYFNITNGSIDKTIQVSESGDYILQIRNNADVEVEVAGFVNY